MSARATRRDWTLEDEVEAILSDADRLARYIHDPPTRQPDTWTAEAWEQIRAAQDSTARAITWIVIADRGTWRADRHVCALAYEGLVRCIAEGLPAAVLEVVRDELRMLGQELVR